MPKHTVVIGELTILVLEHLHGMCLIVTHKHVCADEYIATLRPVRPQIGDDGTADRTGDTGETFKPNESACDGIRDKLIPLDTGTHSYRHASILFSQIMPGMRIKSTSPSKPPSATTMFEPPPSTNRGSACARA